MVPTPIPTVIVTPSPVVAASTPIQTSGVVYGSEADVINTITYWANHYGVSPGWILRVAKCESGYRVNAQNLHYYAGGGHPSGVLQFLPQTFYANAARVGIANPNLWDYRQQAQVAAWMFSIGQWTQWECR